MKIWAGGNSTYGKPYLHIMREHIGEFLILLGRTNELGIQLLLMYSWRKFKQNYKIMEIEHTSFDSQRFVTIVRNLRVKQLYHSDTAIQQC